MLLKLAVRNMRRSLRDYAIYFVTLLIAVTVFYAFNSVGDQQVMHDIAASNNANVIEFTGYMMNIFSVIVALVLGFLVIYANQLLITRRKREFGIYLVLGMRPGQVSRTIRRKNIRSMGYGVRSCSGYVRNTSCSSRQPSGFWRA